MLAELRIGRISSAAAQHGYAYLLAEDLHYHGETHGHELLVVDNPVAVLIDQSCKAAEGVAEETIDVRSNPECYRQTSILVHDFLHDVSVSAPGSSVVHQRRYVTTVDP